MDFSLPPTTKRVKMNTSPRVNSRIKEETRAEVRRYIGLRKDQITKKLEQLDQEWDTERTLEANFAGVVILSTLLGYSVNKKFFALSGLAAVFLLQHALQGWCPPLPIIRHLGIRTAEEINQEKDALRKLATNKRRWTLVKE